METNLQSSEVRIPKSPQSPGSVCPQFKSTFARSLSFNTNTQPNKPLDFEISFRIAQNVDHSSNLSTTTTTAATTVPQSHKVDEVDEDFEEFMRNSPLKQSLQNLSAKSTTPTTPPTRKNATASRAFNTTCSGRHRYQDTQGNKSCSPEIELLRLRKSNCRIQVDGVIKSTNEFVGLWNAINGDKTPTRSQAVCNIDPPDVDVNQFTALLLLVVDKELIPSIAISATITVKRDIVDNTLKAEFKSLIVETKINQEAHNETPENEE